MSLSTPGSFAVNKGRMFKVLCPIEKKGGGTHWMRVGSGFLNKDQSINLHLDALPINHKLQIRELDEEDLQPRGRRRDGDDPPRRADEALPF